MSSGFVRVKPGEEINKEETEEIDLSCKRFKEIDFSKYDLPEFDKLVPFFLFFESWIKEIENNCKRFLEIIEKCKNTKLCNKDDEIFKEFEEKMKKMDLFEKDIKVNNHPFFFKKKKKIKNSF